MFSLFDNPRVRPTAAQLRRIERKLEFLLENLGLDSEEADAPAGQVRELATQGRKLEAVREHRRIHGSSLAQAKRAVEQNMN